MPSPALTKSSPPPPLKQILQVSKSVCKIMDDNMISSGFLIKFFKGDKEFFCLMTNEHSITKEKINQKKKITFTFDYEKKNRK